MSALRKKLLDVFEGESREHLEAIRQALNRLGNSDGGPGGADLTGATRHAHSLKGAARAVGLEDVESLAHRLESVFIAVTKGERLLDPEVRQSVLEALDGVEDAVVATQNGAAAAAQPHDGGGVSQTPTAADPAPDKGPREGPPGQPPQPPVQGSFVRVNAENLDRLLRSAAELHADMLFQNANAVELSRLGREMAAFESRFGQSWRRLQGNLRDGNKSASSGALSGGDRLAAEIKELSKLLRTAAQRQARGARSLRHHLDDLERRVKSARMIPAESVFGSFRKMVRDLAGGEGKHVDVTVDGLDCEADRLVLQRIADPVMHMLRNAVSHGIEPPEERQERGKPARGHVGLTVSNANERLNIVIEDDGRGIDFVRSADKAVEQNRMSREEAKAASRETLVQLLFETGFSTADSVSRLSGRGIGLSVAREALAVLQGTVDVRSETGAGTRIELSLPVSILSRRLLLVSFREQIYALPAESVTKVMRVGADNLVTIEGRPAVRLSESSLPLASLGELLGMDDPALAAGKSGLWVAVVRTSGTDAGVAAHMGLAVDQLLGVNEFVVRNIETGRGGDRLWSGIISTEDGTPCLVLNPGAFGGREFATTGTFLREHPQESGGSKVVLVVDDSITTRTLEKSILEANGYEVRLSVDGRDALGVLRSDPPHIVVSDIEMPHVDGFELVQAMKSDAALSRIPIVLVTSRASDTDRQRGLRLGADAYVVKQKFDQNELLSTIRQII